MEEEIPFNYFHRLFLRNIQKMKVEKSKSTISEDNDMDIIELLFFTKFSKEEMLAIFNEILLDICKDYMISSDSKLDLLPNDPFEFINLILNMKEDNAYWDSFLKSLPYIYQEYFEVLGNGSPYLMGSDDEKLVPCFTINLDEQWHIMNFDIANIELLEQVKIMNRIVSMEMKGLIGPIPKVRFLKKTDSALKVIV